jgi:hypothetical protein
MRAERNKLRRGGYSAVAVLAAMAVHSGKKEIEAAQGHPNASAG